MSAVSTRMQLVGLEEALRAQQEGAGEVAQWVFAQPDLLWCAELIRDVLVACSDAFERLSARNESDTDEQLRAKVLQEVSKASEVAAANNTRRAFETLLSKSTPPKAKKLVLTFLELRVAVEAGTMTEAEASQRAAEARLAL